MDKISTVKAHWKNYATEIILTLLCAIYIIWTMAPPEGGATPLAGGQTFITGEANTLFPIDVHPQENHEDGVIGNLFKQFQTTVFPTLPIIALTSICGYVPSVCAFVIAFIYKTIVDADFAYVMSIQLIVASYMYFITKKKWFKKIPLMLLGLAGLSVIIGNLWWLIFEIVNENGLAGTTSEKMVVFFAGTFIILLPLFLVLYAFFKYCPDKIKAKFHMSRLYTMEYELGSDHKHNSRISVKVTEMIIMAAFFFSISAPFFANILLSRNTLFNVPILDPTTGNFIKNTSMLSFDLKLTLLMLNAAIPIAVVMNYVAQKFFAVPIKTITDYMIMFGSLDDKKRQDSIKLINTLVLNTDDEIATLHDALKKTVNQISDYVGELKKEKTQEARLFTEYIEKVQREKQLETDLDIAQAKNEAKTSFLSNMSHEIRTPINTVLGLDEMILRETSEQPIKEYATEIKNAGRSLLSLINDVLDFSKIEAGKMEIIPVEYELGSTINDLANMISPRAKEKGLALNVNVPADMPRILFGDEIRIKQVVTNILTNAVKYTEKGFVTINAAYEKIDDETIFLKIAVADTGIGIKDEDKSRVTQPFIRVDEKRNRSIEGTGLGMSIVQRLLALMGSEIILDSTYGNGSTFSFAIAQRVIDWTPMGDFGAAYEKNRQESMQYHEKFHAPDAHILVVDDTQLNLVVVKGLLKQTKIQIDTCLSGFDALKMVNENSYNIIFIDHRMPGMDGIETLHAMKAMQDNPNRDVPCVALTANAIAGARDMFIKEGFDDYLSKPVDAIKLEKMIQNLLPKDLVHKISDDTEDEELEEESGIPEMEGVDSEIGIKNCGSKETFLEALHNFSISIQSKADAIERFAKNRDWKNYTVLVHALKSSARLIGASELSDDAKYLEQCGDEEDENEILGKTPSLLALYRSYEKKLANLVHKTNDESKPLIAEKDFYEAMKGLKECTEAFDSDSGDMIIRQMEEYRIPDHLQGKFNKIRELVKEVNRDALLAELQYLKTQDS